MVRCRTIQPLLLDFSSGRLESEAADRVAGHLEGCAGCRRLLERERRTAAVLSSLARVEARSDAWPILETALRSAVAPARSVFPWNLLGRRLSWAGAATAAAALAAAMLVPSLEGPEVRAVSGTRADLEGLRALAPAVAAGIGPERRADPLLAVEDRMDALLDSVSEQPS